MTLPLRAGCSDLHRHVGPVTLTAEEWAVVLRLVGHAHGVQQTVMVPHHVALRNLEEVLVDVDIMLANRGVCLVNIGGFVTSPALTGGVLADEALMVERQPSTPTEGDSFL